MDLVARTPRLPNPGETIIGNTFQTYPGGKGTNQAVACAQSVTREGAQPPMAERKELLTLMETQQK